MNGKERKMLVKTLTLLCTIIFVLVLVAAGTGLFYQTTGNHIEYTTPRGEHATLQGNGWYFYDPAAVAREGRIWDGLNLGLALPLFAFAIAFARQNSLRGRLLLSGMLFYLFYVYLMYATMVAFNPLFLVYVLIAALTPIAFFLNLHEIDVAHLSQRISRHLPRPLFIGFLFVMAATLLVLWIGGRIIPYTLANRFPDEFAGMTTLETQAFDLALVVPLLLTSGILLWRRSEWGYLLGGVSMTFGLLMSCALPAWIAVPLLQDGQINLVEASPFTILCLIGIFVAVQFFRHVDEGGRTTADGSQKLMAKKSAV
jgi:hypothetical protein